MNGAKGVLFSIAGGDDLTMFEIQDAAKVITESADPNAKIIFGAFKDESLKKGEVKITVIASNFPENANRKTIFQTADIDKPKIEPKEDSGKIYNSIPIKTDEPKNIVPEEEDDWGAVPAFLRRNRK
jgi:cell division protein FtsZ